MRGGCTDRLTEIKPSGVHFLKAQLNPLTLFNYFKYLFCLVRFDKMFIYFNEKKLFLIITRIIAIFEQFVTLREYMIILTTT